MLDYLSRAVFQLSVLCVRSIFDDAAAAVRAVPRDDDWTVDGSGDDFSTVALGKFSGIVRGALSALMPIEAETIGRTHAMAVRVAATGSFGTPSVAADTQKATTVTAAPDGRSVLDSAHQNALMALISRACGSLVMFYVAAMERIVPAAHEPVSRGLSDQAAGAETLQSGPVPSEHRSARAPLHPVVSLLSPRLSPMGMRSTPLLLRLERPSLKGSLEEGDGTGGGKSARGGRVGLSEYGVSGVSNANARLERRMRLALGSIARLRSDVLTLLVRRIAGHRVAWAARLT